LIHTALDSNQGTEIECSLKYTPHHINNAWEKFVFFSSQCFLIPQIHTRNIINNKIRVNTSQRRITHSEATMEKIRVSDGKTCHSVKPLHDGSSNSRGDKVGSPFRPTWNVLMSIYMAPEPSNVPTGYSCQDHLWSGPSQASLLAVSQTVLHVNENDETTRKQRRLRLPFAIHVLKTTPLWNWAPNRPFVHPPDDGLCGNGLLTRPLSIHQMMASVEMGS
jgi:hypothetical protein